jgi:pilus assembly protein Flp/PilA
MHYVLLTLARVTRKLRRDKSGATAIEYGMIAAGIAVVIITTVFAIGPLLNTAFVTVQTELENGPTTGGP